jgi:hypothetical protein
MTNSDNWGLNVSKVENYMKKNGNAFFLKQFDRAIVNAKSDLGKRRILIAALGVYGTMIFSGVPNG